MQHCHFGNHNLLGYLYSLIWIIHISNELMFLIIHIHPGEGRLIEQHREVGFFDILKSRTLLVRLLVKTLIAITSSIFQINIFQVNYINWTVINLCYYGLTMNSVNLHGNTFLNTMIGVIIEAPGYLLAMLTMDRFGRKPILVICQIVSGGYMLSILYHY